MLSRNVQNSQHLERHENESWIFHSNDGILFSLIHLHNSSSLTLNTACMHVSLWETWDETWEWKTTQTQKKWSRGIFYSSLEAHSSHQTGICIKNDSPWTFLIARCLDTLFQILKFSSCCRHCNFVCKQRCDVFYVKTIQRHTTHFRELFHLFYTLSMEMFSCYRASP